MSSPTGAAARRVAAVLLAAAFAAAARPAAAANTGIVISTSAADGTAEANNRKLVRASNGDLYAVRVGTNAGFKHIFLNKSVNNGSSWTEVSATPIVHNGDSKDQVKPALAIDSLDNLHMVWQGNCQGLAGCSDTGGEEMKLQYSSSPAGGTNWGAWKQIPGHTYQGGEGDASLIVDGNDVLHVVWHGEGPGGNYGVRYSSRPAAGGQFWSAYSDVMGPAASPNAFSNASITIDSSDILHVVGHGGSSPGQIRHSSKSLTTAAWSAPQNISNLGGYNQQFAVIAADSSGQLHAVWNGQDAANGNYQIKYAKRSAAQVWSTPVNIAPISTVNEYNPSIAVAGSGDLHVVWHSSDTNPVTNIKFSTNSGTGWSPWTNLSNGGADQTFPNLRWAPRVHNGGTPDLVWTDNAVTPNNIRFSSSVIGISQPVLVGPASGSYISTTSPTFVWKPAAGSFSASVATDPGFATVVISSAVPQSFFVSTQTLAAGATYWWRVKHLPSGEVSTVASFVVDAASPAYSGPQVSTAAAPWTNLPMTTYLSSNVVTARITVQDSLAGLLVSSGPPSGLAGQWHFDESSGTTVLDAAGISAPGDFSGGPGWGAGKRGGALDLASNGSFVQVPHDPAHNASELTIELWIKPSLTDFSLTGGDPFMALVAKRTSNSQTPYVFGIRNGGTLSLNWWDSLGGFPSPTSPPIVKVNAWQHVAVTRTGSPGNYLTTFYYNGAPFFTSVDGVPGTVLTSTQDLLIGKDAYFQGQTTQGTYRGLVDEVRIFNVARSSAQILADYLSDTLAAHNRGKAFAAQYSTNGGAAWNFVSTNSVTLTGADGTTGAQTLTAANIPLVTSTAALAPTNLVRFIASDMAGNVGTTTYAVLVDTTTPNPPGCGIAANVRKNGFNAFTTISAAVASLPSSLAGTSCVVVRDTQTYTEQVVVQGFANNGYQLIIMSDPSFVSSAPLVSAAAMPSFVIKNASVTLRNFMVRPNGAANYGVQASSAYVTLSSVNVDAGAFVNFAGVELSSWSVLSNSSITVQSAHGLLLKGVGTLVEFSTMTNNAASPYSALYVSQGASNTITRSYISNPGGYGAYLDATSSNTISFSTMTSAGTFTAGLYLSGASSNTVTSSYIQNPVGHGLTLASGAQYNTISLSTFSSSASGRNALYIVGGSSWNVISQSLASNPNGSGAWLDGADRNTISQSTLTSNASGANYALYLTNSDSNTVTGSYMQNLAGYGADLDSGANYNTISQSTMVSNSSVYYALNFFDSDRNTVTGSFIQNLAGHGAVLNTGSDYNAISQSTMVSDSAAFVALWIRASDSNTVTGSYMQNLAGYGADLDTGADYNTISQSTMVSNSALYYALYLFGSDSNTVTGSYISNPPGNGARLDSGSDYNTISQSTITSNTAAFSAFFIAGSSFNTVAGSYIQGSTAAVVFGSTGTAINSSVLVATNTIGSALALQGGGGSHSVASSTLRGGPSGRGLLLDAGNTGVVSIGSVTVTGSARGLEISTQAAGFVLAIDSVTFRSLTAGATAIHFLGGTFSSTITLANFEDAGVGANVSAAALDPASRVRMRAHYGARTGPVYENDPNSLVFWQFGPLPGCAATANVSPADYETITAAVASLPQSLPGTACVVVRDTQTYSEQVAIQGFTNNGFQLKVMSDPSFVSSAPVVRPPGASTAGFLIKNASVTLQGFMVRPNAAISYGVQSSSAYVTISSVNVDAGALVSVAGIAISSWSSVSYSSITSSVHGLYVDGSSNTVYHSTMTSGGGTYALYLKGASSTTVQRSWLLGGQYGAIMEGGANFNTISESTITSNSPTGGCLSIRVGSSSNTVTRTYMQQYASANCAIIEAGSSYNTISLSTMATNAGPWNGLFVQGSSYNVVTQSFISNSGGTAARLDAGSNSNTISLSTMVSSSGSYALYLVAADSNTVTGSYMQNLAGYGAVLNTGSDSNVISFSTIVTNTAAEVALWLSASDSNTVTGSYISNPSGTGARLDGGADYNAISLSTMVSNSVALYALNLSAASTNTISQCYVSNPAGTAARLEGGAAFNTLSQSTFTTNYTFGHGLQIVNASSNTLSQSVVFNANGFGARLTAGSNYNLVTQSRLTTGGGSYSAVDLDASSFNVITQSYLSGPGGRGASLDNKANRNTISFSTMTSNSVYYTLRLNEVSSTTITNCYIQDSTAVFVSGSSNTYIIDSVIESVGGRGIWMLNGGSGLTVTSSAFSGSTGDAAIFIDTGSAGKVSLGSVTVTGAWRGLVLSTQAPGFVLAVDSITFRGLTPGATAIHFLGGTFSSTITLANFEDAGVGANVSAAALDPASRVRMRAHSGTRTGPTYENDPSGLVFWQSGPFPGCVVTANVGPADDYVTISSGVAGLPGTLTGHSCVVIRDGATYNEQVTVQGFTNNGSSITILADPASSTVPRVNPPMSSLAAFVIRNSSVNLAGIQVRPTNILTYGIYVSSPYVTISSVIVNDAVSMINTAGIALSSWTTVSYTSVTVSSAYAFLLPGSTMTTVSYSSATNSNPTNPAMLLAGAFSNTITRMQVNNQSGGGAVRFDAGGYNTVNRSSFSTPSGGSGLYINASSFNAVTASYMSSGSGYGARLESANFNSISQSTAVSNMTAIPALYLNNSSSNSIGGVFASNPSGYGAYLAGSSSNTLSLSTFTGGGITNYGLFITGGGSNTIAGSYASNAGGPGAYFNFTSSNTLSQTTVVGGAAYYGLQLNTAAGNQIIGSNMLTGANLNNGSNQNVITGSTFTQNSLTLDGLQLQNASSNTVSQSFMTNPLGRALAIGAGGIANYNSVSQSTITSNTGTGALYLNGTGNNLVSAYIANPGGYGAEVTNANYSTILQSTITNNSAAFAALYLSNSATNTFTQSVIVNGAGNGVNVEAGANWNSFQRSVVNGGGSGFKIQSVTGLVITHSTATGGGGAGSAGVSINAASEYITVSNSYVQGSTAVYISGSTRTSVNANVLAGTGAAGSGLWMTNNSIALAMSSNTVLGGGLAGIAIDSNSGGLIRVSTNTVFARGAPFAVSAANLNAAATVWITSNTIVPSLSASATTYGVYLNSLTGGATVQNNGIFFRNSGAAYGGVGAGAYGLYASASSGVKIDRNRISNPSMAASGNYIGAGLSALTSPIFKFNDLYSTGSGLTTFNLLRIDGSPNAVVRNNILSSSMTATNNRMIVVDAPSQTGFSSDYNTFFSSNASYSGLWGGGVVTLLANWIATTGRDANTLLSNPRWLNPVGEDFHPLSREGRWNGAAFVQDALDAPGIDRGDPADPIDDEVQPNGARANQGSYGQTAEASQTVLPCPVTRYVRQAGGGDSVTIQGGIAALPNPIVGGHSCVVIGDGNIYNEQVTVQGFTNNGSSITIMLDPSLTVHPIVRQGFIIRNASVNVVNIDVAPNALAIGYGLFASSSNIKISSVNINDPGGFITAAGVALSSYSSLSYSSISVQGAHGLRLDGKFALVSYSTMTSNSSLFHALYIAGADSNTVTGSYISNPLGYGAYFDVGSDYNAISQSSAASGAISSGALYLTGSDFNTVTGSYISNPAGNGAFFSSGSDSNVISISTLTSNTLSYFPLYISASASNTVTGSYISNPSGYAAYLYTGADYNTISLSTMIGGAANDAALYLTGSDFNTVTQSYMSNPAGYGAQLVGGSNNNSISQSTMTSNSASFPALYISNADSNTVTGSNVSNSTGWGASLESGADYNTISQSTVTSNSSSARALGLLNSDFNAVTGSMISNPAGIGAYLDTGSDYNTIIQSTVTSNSAVFGALYITNASSNTVLSSYIQGSTATLISGSTGTIVNASVLVATNTTGSALVLQGGGLGLAMSSNTIISGAQGKGVYLDISNAGTITLSTNTIRGGQYGVYVSTQQNGTALWITSNTIVPAPSAAFITYGLYLNGLVSGATIQNNGVYYRSPANTGGVYTAAIEAKGSAGLVISGNRFSNPGMITGSVLGIGLTGTPNTVFKFNDVHSTGTAIASAYHMRLTGSPGAQLSGNVFSSSWSVTGSSAALFVDAASQAGFVSDYNDFFSSNSFNSIEWGIVSFPFPWSAATGQDRNSIARHPRWKDVSPGVEDFHHLSQAGRWDGASFVVDGFTSALLDAADPLESVGGEATPNGGRANLGSYGKTAEASKSPAPPASPVLAGVFVSSISVSYGLVSADGYVLAASTAADLSGTLFSSTTASGALAVLTPQGLAANTTYFLRAAASWGDFLSVSGVLLTTATLANSPAAAAPAFGGVNLSSLTVTWLPNGNFVGITTYSVVLTTGASFPNSFAGNQTFSTVPAGALPTATRTGLAQNTTYFVFAAALNWNGVPSTYAALGSTATLADVPLTAASTFSAVGFSSFTVSWSANGNPLAITTYTVSLSTAADFNAFASSFSFSTAPAFGPSATFTGLGANEIYYFRVRALNHQGVATAYAVLGSTETRPVTLQPPVVAGLTAVNVSSISATWGLSSLATGYTLVASLTNDPAAVFASSSPLGINATTATVFAPALNANTTYYLFVRATGPGAVTSFSAYPATSTLAAVPLTAVSTFTSVQLTSMTVSWLPGGNPIGVTTYTVVLSTGTSYPNAFTGNRTISTMPAGAGPAASIAGLNDNTAYYLYVAGVNHNGVTGVFAALGSTVTRISPPASVVFDEISSNTIVASAYAPTPFFSNLSVGQSGTRMARNGTYQNFHGEQWVSTTSMPAPRREAGAAGFSGKVYVFGGFNGAAAQNTAAVYDPATTLWTTLPVMTSARGGLAAAAAGGRIYALGGTFDGFTSLNVNEEYDPVGNGWATKTVLGTRSDHLTAAGVGGALYAFGGVTDGADNVKNAQYDPTANAWTNRPDFPAAQHQMAAAVAAGPMAGTVIAAGGSGPANSNYAYDTAANTWALKAAMPAAVEEAAAASLGGKIYVIGGAGAPAAQTVYEYDPAADLWAARAGMITGREGLSAVAAGGRIYALGGSADGGATSLGTSEEYDPGVATRFAGLTPNTQAGFKAQARNQTGTVSAETIVISTWTWAALPGAVAPPFAVVAADSVTFAWALNGNPGATEFKARASTAASFGGGAAVLASDWGAMTSTAALALSPNTTYFFSVQARNGIGGVPGIVTAFVNLGSTATLAALPAAAPAPFPSAATNGLTVSWLPNGNPLSVTTYTVVVSTDAVYPNAHTGNVTIASTQPAGGLPTASFTGLVANTTYFAFSSAVNWNGLRTAYAALGSTATLALPPAAAAPAFAAVHESSATFSWLPNGNPVNVTTYSVVLSTGGAYNTFAGNLGFSTTPAGALPTATVAAGLMPNTTYFGYAAAINVNGAVSAYTSLGSTATLAAAPATAVTTFTAVNIASITVSWSAGGNPLAITTYTVQLSTAADFNAFATSVTFTTAPAAGPSATFTGLTDYTQFFFRVRALNHGGSATAFVNLGSTTTLVAPLAVPALAGFPSVDITSITATWGLVSGATGYTLVASSYPANPPTVVAASSTTFAITATTAAALLPALDPNTTYFLFVKANGPLRSSLYAAYGATSTLSSPPATVVSTFTGVGITSFTVSWSANGNALAITTYTVQLSTAPDFNAFATSVTFTTVPVFGPSTMITGLSGNTSYYLRIRALNHNGMPSAYVSLGSTLTAASPLFPTILNSQTGDAVWRRANTALYSVAFLDTSGSHLDKFQVKASTTAGGLGSDIAPFTDVVIGLSPIDTYSTPWALPASVFNLLLEGVTNYISVKVFNGPPLNNFTVLQDAFYVQKDTTSPVVVDTQTGDGVARSVAGTTYTVGVRDPSSGLAAFQYSASLAPGTANASLIGWTDIAVVANTTSYNTPWPVDFAQLISGVTNYISVRSWDTAGATTTLTDAFFVHKDTTGPSVAIAAPQNGSFYSSLATLSGTAASIYGVQGTEVSILDVASGFYWNPASVAFNSAAPIMIPAAGAAAWTLSPGITWADGATYRAVARSSTTANLYSTIYATSTFVMDLSTPTVGVLAPAPNSTVAVLPQISGTAADPAPNPSGLSSVEVRLRRNADGQWWNWFTQAWGPAAVSSVTAGTTAWSLTPTPELKASLKNGASYFIAVRASDNALPSNAGDFFVSGATFTWQDVTPPSAVADLAASHGALPGRINLNWTAPGDDAGVGLIALGEYRIFYSTDIAAAASTSAAQVIIATSGVYPGALQAYTLIGLNPSVTYYVRLALDDGDGNWSSFSNQASTTAAPSPVNAITGHVLDISTQGITAVQVDCWNAADALVGTTFTLADGSGTYTVNGLGAGNYKLRVTWTVNGFSSSLWQDGISMGSSNVDFFLNINYALATLTGTLSTLTTSSFGGGGLSAAAASESFIELHQQGRQVARTSVQPGGRWTIAGLLPGTYSVRAHTGLGYTAFQDVVLSEGEVRVLGFVFNPLPEASVFAFPNPARTATTIRFETALDPLEAGIYIFDLAGNLVKEISDSQISRAAAPVYRAAWDLNNASGQSVAPGVYHVMVKIKGGSDNQSAKVIKKLAVVR